MNGNNDNCSPGIAVLSQFVLSSPYTYAGTERACSHTAERKINSKTQNIRNTDFTEDFMKRRIGNRIYIINPKAKVTNLLQPLYMLPSDQFNLL